MISWTITCCLIGLGAGSHSQVLEPFSYSTDAEAQRVWRAVAERGQEPRLHVHDTDEGKVLELALPFADQPHISRVFIDRDVAMNLAAAGGFELDVESYPPTAGARLSLYFRSGDGWYAGGGELAGSGWRTLRFSKADFVKEGRPAGWQQIDGLRIAIWRGQSKNGCLRLKLLKATQHDIALILPSAAGEVGVDRMVQNVAQMLEELGLGSDAIEPSAVNLNSLADRRVVILAHNPNLSDHCTDALVQYVQRGGKLLVCYLLPRKLGDVLGFGSPTYYRPPRAGALAEIRFKAPDVVGLPDSVRQRSWNITTAQPVGYHARTIGEWFDDQGQPMDQAAVLLSDRGAFYSHVVLTDDRDQKKQMLAALLGHLAPALWQQMADGAIQRCSSIGHFTSNSELLELLQRSDVPQVAQLVSAAESQKRQIVKKYAARKYAEVVDLARQLRADRIRAYLLAQPSRQREGRAYWNHTGTGAFNGDWERTARQLSDAGFNMVMPNMLWGGLAHYPSDLLPRSKTYAEFGDQIAQCVTAAKKHGLQVHVWKVNWNLSGAPREFIEAIHQEGRNQVSVDGKAHDWLCPSHPENFRLELDSMLEVARNYDVDGLHFDYIRYPDRDKCYCQGCRKRFQTQCNQTVANWPEDCYAGELRQEYAEWRQQQISRLVAAVHDQAKSMRPDIEISAAVFGAYPSCKESVGQDWLKWVQQGYLDFVCPMDYSQNDQAFVGLVENQLRLVDQRIPVYPGIGQWRLSEDRTVGQIYLARQLGAPGFTLFDLSSESIKTAVPAVGLGVGREKASTPHRGIK